MKSKLASYVVDHRRGILMVMLLIALISAFLMTKVGINTDMTKYLPDKSEMKQGIDIMSEEFPDAQTSQTIRVMFDHLKPEEIEEIHKRLSDIPYVTGVAYEADSPDYNRDDHTLFVISTDAEYKSSEIKSIEKALDQDFSDYTMAWHDDDTGSPEVPAWILLSGVGIILVVLLIMCGSWIEPFLFLIGIGFAVVINLGTNIFMGSVSYVTYSIAAILQLALSMDYSIILINRYRQEKEKNEEICTAMKAAVEHAFPSIVSSGMTTVAGLLMLVFMSFRIGMDLGVVLAKGVFLSMLCVLIIMPGIFIICDGLIRKTAKKSPHIRMKALAAFSVKAHKAILVVFVLLMAAAFLLQQRTVIVYTLAEEDNVADVFPADNTLVLLYDNQDEAAVPKICDLLKEDSMVKSVMSWYSVLGTPYTAEEMARNIAEMQQGMSLDENVLSMIYYARYAEDKELTMTVSEFLSFLSGHVIDNELFSEYISEDQRSMIRQISEYGGLVNLIAGTDPRTPQQMAELFSRVVPDMDEASLELMFLYKAGIENGNPEWTMTMEELFDYLYNTLQYDQRFSQLMGEDVKSMLSEGYTALTEGKNQLVGKDHSRMIITTKYPEESEETFAFIENLSSVCDENFKEKYYMIGVSSMNLEMSRSFGSELLFITVLTAVVIYLIVALSTRSFFIPLILVMIVQTGVYLTITSIGLQGNTIYYLALLIVQCILMGATIDYGIVFTYYYLENRRISGISEAVGKAYEGAIHTIATSGTILVLVILIVGRFFRDPTIMAICETISLGSFIAILLILICLPGILICFDKVITNTAKKENHPT